MLNYVLAESSEVTNYLLLLAKQSFRKQPPRETTTCVRTLVVFLPIKQTRYNLVIGEL